MSTLEKFMVALAFVLAVIAVTKLVKKANATHSPPAAFIVTCYQSGVLIFTGQSAGKVKGGDTYYVYDDYTTGARIRVPVGACIVKQNPLSL